MPKIKNINNRNNIVAVTKRYPYWSGDGLFFVDLLFKNNHRYGVCLLKLLPVYDDYMEKEKIKLYKITTTRNT